MADLKKSIIRGQLVLGDYDLPYSWDSLSSSFFDHPYLLLSSSKSDGNNTFLQFNTNDSTKYQGIKFTGLSTYSDIQFSRLVGSNQLDLKIDNNKIITINESGLLTITSSNGAGIKSYNATQQLQGGTGFSILNNGVNWDQYIDNLFVRGSMHVWQFVINQIRATNGDLYVSDTSKINNLVINSNVITASLDTPYIPFVYDDLLRAKRVFVNGLTNISSSSDAGIIAYDILFKVLATSSFGLQNNVIMQIVYTGSQYDLAKFQTNYDNLVRVGNISNTDRQGNIYLSSNQQHSPFIDIVDNIDSVDKVFSPTTQNNLKTKLGNLKSLAGYQITQNITLPVQPGYGLFSQNVYLSGLIVSQTGSIGGWKISSSGIYKDNIAIDSTKSAIYIGQGEYNNSNTPFYVDNLGRISLGTNLYYSASTLVVDGTITASYGEIGKWVITPNYLRSSNTTGSQITLDAGLGKIYVGAGTFSNSNTSFYIDSSSKFSIKDKFIFDGTNLTINGSINANTGSIGGWNIYTNSIAKNFVQLSSQMSPYINTSSVYPSSASEIYLLNSSSFKSSYNIDDRDQPGAKSMYFKSCSTITMLANDQPITVQFAYLISSSMQGVHGQLDTNSSIYLQISTVTSSTDYLGTGVVSYKLIGGNVGRKMSVQYSNKSGASRYVMFRIKVQDPAVFESQYYDNLTVSDITVQNYNPLIQLSQNGLFIFNNPANYIKLGYLSQSGYYQGIAQFKGTAMQVKDLTVYGNFYNYGQTYTAGNNLLGTTSDRFTINTDASSVNEKVTLQLKSSENNFAQFVYDDTTLTISAPNTQFTGKVFLQKSSSSDFEALRSDRSLTITSQDGIITVDNTSSRKLTQDLVWNLSHKTSSATGSLQQTGSYAVQSILIDAYGHVNGTTGFNVRNAFSASNSILINTQSGLIELDYDSSNLKIENNKINTIQDIHQNAYPTFSGLKIQFANVGSSLNMFYSGSSTNTFNLIRNSGSNNLIFGDDSVNSFNLIVNSKSGIFVNSLGSVGIGNTNPDANTKLHVSGVFKATTIIQTSLRRQKQNINNITQSVLQDLLKLQPIEYNLISDPYKQQQVGLIAQDTNQIFPLICGTNQNKELTGVEYSRLTIYLLKGMQQLIQTNNKLQKELNRLKEIINATT